MYKNNNQNIVVKWKDGFQTAELNLGDTAEVGSYSSNCHGPFTEQIKQEVKSFCVYSKNNIKIFKLSEWPEDRNSNIYEIYCEEALTWWQRVIRFVSFGHLYSNKSNLLAQIYAVDQLSWWQRAINFVSGGYFYRTTAKIDGKEFKYLGNYGSYDYDVEPALLTYTQTVDQEKSNFTGIQNKNDWILYEKLPNIENDDMENQLSSPTFNAPVSNISFNTVSGISSPFGDIEKSTPKSENSSCVINNPYNDTQDQY